MNKKSKSRMMIKPMFHSPTFTQTHKLLLTDAQAKAGRLHQIPTKDHFNHPSLSEIKEAILLIGHVPANGSIITDMKPPQVQHTKDIAWKIKCSTLSLPMLDILNRNFPKLLNDLTLCLLCKSNILQESADKSSLCITDSVKYSPTFRWAFHNESIHQSVLLLLRSYVTDLYDIFIRSNIWKDWKSANGLTKNDFKNYAKNFHRNNQQTSSDEFMLRREVRHRTTREYVNSHFDFRNYKNHTDLLFILFSLSNFLHSGPFYNHCRCEYY
ncbi:hypothetical protein RhiirA1_459506 [Rhizophagus irregularis]|uniref:Uncharacterized protein n=1 Tax=Rhizophagus irregularis TaxID=588596 RepID=A0A2N0RTH9_9GLOM|nr:hypothetical protein RhiirA1_459506 [Rhizophagus irregularis]